MDIIPSGLQIIQQKELFLCFRKLKHLADAGPCNAALGHFRKRQVFGITTARF